MTAKRIRLLVIGLVVALAAGLLLYPSDEKRVREVMEAIVEGANQDQMALGRALLEHAVDDVTVNITDLPRPLVGREDIVGAAGRTEIEGRKLRFRMQAVEVSVEGSNARVNAELVASLSLGIRQLSQARSGVDILQKIDGRFKLVSIDVGAERHDQPEARP